jgi:hypothetical protein
MNIKLVKDNLKVILVIVPTLLLIIANLVILINPVNQSSNFNKANHHIPIHSAKTSHQTTKYSWPSPPLQCRTNISLVSLSTDYVISGMSCSSSKAKNNAYISCDGSDFSGSINLNCYRPPKYSFNNQLICRGKVTTAYGVNPILLTYNCSQPKLNSPILYNCSGAIYAPSISAVSAPITVSCT